MSTDHIHIGDTCSYGDKCPDRPTGPATLAETRLRGRFGHLLMVRADRHGTESASVVLDEALNDARAAERARIFAALPAALASLLEPYSNNANATKDFAKAQAAALVAAIEKALGQ